MDRREFLKLGSVSVLGAVGSSLQGRATGTSDGLAFEPKAIDGPIVNPGIGFETFHCFNEDDRIARASNYPECSIAYFRFYWDLLEPTEGKYSFNLIDSLLQKAAERGQDLALRFMPTCPGNLKRGTPKWFMQKGKGFAYERRGRKGWAPDHNDPYYLARQQALVQAFGERYNGHRRLIRMEIGNVGFWGEWHMSHTKPVVPMITVDNAVKVIDMYRKHWDKTPLCMLIGFVPGLRYAVSRGTGWRADSLGDYGHWSDTWCHMMHSYPRKLKEAKAHDAWKRGPVAFEPPGSMRDLERYVPSKGGGYGNMWKQALAWGGSAFNPKSGPIPAAQVPAMKRFLAKCGYRIVLRRLVTPKSIARADRHLPIAMDFENQGVAPPYKDYALAVRMSGGTAPIVLKSSAKVREWLPGPHKLGERLQLPDGLGAGQYALAIALLDPADQQPAVRLANGGRNRDGWYPVGTIEVT